MWTCVVCVCGGAVGDSYTLQESQGLADQALLDREHLLLPEALANWHSFSAEPTWNLLPCKRDQKRPEVQPH